MEVWKQSLQLASRVTRIVARQNWEVNRGLRDQLQRASASIPSNIAEGEEQISNKASLKFYYIARGSLSEVRTQLILSQSLGLLGQDEFLGVDNQCELVGRLIGGVIRCRRKRDGDTAA